MSRNLFAQPVAAAAIVWMAAALIVVAKQRQPGSQGAGRAGSAADVQACGGRSDQPHVPCADDVAKMREVLPAKSPAAPKQPRRVLVYGRATGYQHSSIPLAARMIEEMGKKTRGWTTDTSYDAAAMSADSLKAYDAVFLASTTGTFLDDPGDQHITDARRKALLEFVRGGKGLAGIHAAADSYHGGGAGRGAAGGPGRAPVPACSAPPGNGGGAPLWPDFNNMIGGYFKFHWVYPTPITVKIDDPRSPINAAFKGRSFNTIDEVYTFNQDSWSRENLHVLTSIDYSLMTDCQKGLEVSPRTDHDFGLSWIRREGNGRVFYEALGHSETIYYNNPAMLEHILAGMQYALGDLAADDSPSVRPLKKTIRSTLRPFAKRYSVIPSTEVTSRMPSGSAARLTAARNTSNAKKTPQGFLIYGDGDVFVVPADGGKRRRLTDHPATDTFDQRMAVIGRGGRGRRLAQPP